MDAYYNFHCAATRLQLLSAERSKERLAGLQLADWNAERLADLVKVVKQQDGGFRRLTTGASSQHEREEVELVFHIQGVLTLVELPPFTARGRLRDKVKFLRQGIRLSGMGTASFDSVVSNIMDIVAIYSRSVTKVQAPSFLGEDEQGAYLELSNRFFSSTRDRRGGRVVNFSPEIDPNRVLESLGGDRYYHGEENTVMYLERTQNSLTGKKVMSPVSPVIFKKGDIAEAQVTFTLIPLKDGEWKMVATLRCVTLLDGTFTQDCVRAGIQLHADRTRKGRDQGGSKPLKRRYGFDLDDTEGDKDRPVEKMIRMEIDEEGMSESERG